MEYVLKSSRMFYGLSTRDIRQLAAGFARKMGIAMPQSWRVGGMAGKDWFIAFMQRHPNLSLRKPQATSLARIACFNPHNVAAFFRNLAAVMDETKVRPENIWNMDESSLTTVPYSERVVAERGARQVGQAVSRPNDHYRTCCVCRRKSHCTIFHLSTRPLTFTLFERCTGWFNGRRQYIWMADRRYIFPLHATFPKECQFNERATTIVIA